MKEIHIKPDNADLMSDTNKGDVKNFDQRRKSSRKERMAHLEPTYLETHVEIYVMNNQQPTLGAIVNVREVDPEFDPKNITQFHKEGDSDDEEKRPINLDFNFCCWYLIDKKNHNINFTVLLDRFQVNMRTHYDIDPITISGVDLQKHIVVASNL